MNASATVGCELATIVFSSTLQSSVQAWMCRGGRVKMALAIIGLSAMIPNACGSDRLSHRVSLGIVRKPGDEQDFALESQ